MDSFTVAVVIGGVVVLLVLGGLVLLDRGEPSPNSKTPKE